MAEYGLPTRKDSDGYAVRRARELESRRLIRETIDQEEFDGMMQKCIREGMEKTPDYGKAIRCDSTFDINMGERKFVEHARDHLFRCVENKLIENHGGVSMSQVVKHNFKYRFSDFLRKLERDD